MPQEMQSTTRSTDRTRREVPPRASGTVRAQRRHGPSSSTAPIDPIGEAAAHDMFRSLFKHRSQQVKLPGLEQQLAGTRLDACRADRRMLVAAQRAGLPREWAERYLAWLTAQIDALWSRDHRSLGTLRCIAEHAEGEGNDTMLASMLTHDSDDAALAADEAKLIAEMALDRLVLVGIQRRRAELRAGGR